MSIPTMTELFNLLNKFDEAEFPIEKQNEISKLRLSKRARQDLHEALETVLSYKEDFPEELLQGLQDLAKRAVKNAAEHFEKSGEDPKWPSLTS